MIEKLLNKSGLKILTTELKFYSDTPVTPQPSYTPSAVTNFKIANGILTKYTGNENVVVTPKTYSLQESVVDVYGALLSSSLPISGVVDLSSYGFNVNYFVFTDGNTTQSLQYGGWSGSYLDFQRLREDLSRYFDLSIAMPTFIAFQGVPGVLAAVCNYSGNGDSFLSFPLEVDNQTFNNFSDFADYCTSLGTSSVEMNFYYPNQQTRYIPIEGTDYQITGIGASAFSSNATLYKAIILNNITSIGASAFSSCTQLEEIIFEKNSTITAIPAHFCASCSKLKTINIPDTVTSIGGAAFSLCYALKNIALPNNLTTFGTQVFRYCRSLPNLKIPSGVTSLTSGLFEYAVFGELYIPANITSVHYGVIMGATINRVIVDPENTIYDSRNECNCIIETATNTLIAGSNTASIPNTVEEIGQYAFEYSKLTGSITIPKSVKRIGNYAFAYSDITSVTINSIEQPEGTSYNTAFSRWGEYIFGYCNKLTSITFASGVLVVPNDLCYNCKALTTVTLPNTVIVLGGSTFSGCVALNSITLPESLKYIYGATFSSCKSLSSITFPSNLIGISNGAFRYCSNLTTVDLPSSIQSFQNGSTPVFGDCVGLKTAYLRFVNSYRRVTAGANYAWFYNCNASLKLYIPSAVSNPSNRYGTYWNYYSSSGTLSYTANL